MAISATSPNLSELVAGQARDLRHHPRTRADQEKTRATGAADIAWQQADPLTDATDNAVGGGAGTDGATDAATGPGGANLVDTAQRAKETRVAAESFAGFFLGHMLKEMRKTVELSPVGHGSDSAERMFQELADEAYADEAARAAGNAITDLVYRGLMNGARLPQ